MTRLMVAADGGPPIALGDRKITRTACYHDVSESAEQYDEANERYGLPFEPARTSRRLTA
jgi:hypothetical protein